MDAIPDILHGQRLVVVSNRLPIVLESDTGTPKVVSASGGLVTVMEPLLKYHGGLWIGWPGHADVPEEEINRILTNYKNKEGYDFSAVLLSRSEVDLYYEGFSNAIIWPLFHDLQTECHFVPEFWKAYKLVNRKFAKVTASQVKETDFVWVHDYQLLLLGQELRTLGVKSRLIFFLHIPFAPLDIFLKIPWRFEILRAMLCFDFIGFQTKRDERNFLDCLRALCPDANITDVENHFNIETDKRNIYVGAFPIGLDYKDFENTAFKKNVFDEMLKIKGLLPHGKIVFSVDRLDYTKGIPYRLDGIRNFLKRYPEMHGKVTFIQQVVPSRIHIKEYQELKSMIDREVSEINSEYSHMGWIPIHYQFQAISRDLLVSYYRAADVILVAPLKDGMNLVVKEYIASNVDESGVVILSEFAGAAAQLKNDVLLINPFDIEGIADAINYALNMPDNEKFDRMHNLRENVRLEDCYSWVTSIVAAAAGRTEPGATEQKEYFPSENLTFDS